MAQYPRPAATTSDGGHGAQDLARGTSSATSAGFAGRGAGAYPQGMPSSAEPMPAGAALGVAGGGAMGAKQREAYQEQQRFRVANQGVAGSNGAGGEPMSPTDTDSTMPFMYTGGGRADEEEAPPMNLGADIPPT